MKTKKDGSTEINGATLVENQGRIRTGITEITFLAMLVQESSKSGSYYGHSGKAFSVCLF